MDGRLRIVVGITGSTGAIYGIRVLEELKRLGHHTHLVLSEWGEKCIAMETEYNAEQVRRMAGVVSDGRNMAASISSGTHATDGMIVAPCSMKTLSAIANGYDDTLVARAAGVTIKESRRLVLMARESPALGHPPGEHAEAGPVGRRDTAPPSPSSTPGPSPCVTS